MNNTLQKSIDPIRNTDGTLVYRYKKKTVGSVSPFGGIFMVALGSFFCAFPGAFFAGVIIAGALQTILPKSLYSIATVTAILGGLACFLALIFLLFKIFFIGFKKEFTVKPGEYIKFGSHTVPFVEVQTIGTESKSVGSGSVGEVFLMSNGTRASIAGDIEPMFANALADEIRRQSGRTWA